MCSLQMILFLVVLCSCQMNFSWQSFESTVDTCYIALKMNTKIKEKVCYHREGGQSLLCKVMYMLGCISVHTLILVRPEHLKCDGSVYVSASVSALRFFCFVCCCVFLCMGLNISTLSRWSQCELHAQVRYIPCPTALLHHLTRTF